MDIDSLSDYEGDQDSHMSNDFDNQLLITKSKNFYGKRNTYLNSPISHTSSAVPSPRNQNDFEEEKEKMMQINNSGNF